MSDENGIAETGTAESPVALWDGTETPKGKATYVVQRYIGREERSDERVWEDVARQHFPLKTQAKTVLLTVVVEMMRLQPIVTDRFRVLDASASRERALVPKPREAPEYEVV